MTILMALKSPGTVGDRQRWQAMDLEERIRRRAYQIWMNEGCPEGRAEAHWDMATELVAIEDGQKATLVPADGSESTGPTGEPIEPLEAAENQGEFPALTDQGEESASPSGSIER